MMDDQEGEDVLPENNNDFSDPVYKELVIINGKINGMDKNHLITNLKRLQLSTAGSLPIMRRRLKNHYKTQKLSSANLLAVSRLYPYYVVVDFEATCNNINPPNFPHEIIEFPAVLVDSQKQTCLDEFHSYVKPTLNSTLSQFCIQLTGITQDIVNKAEEFPQVLSQFETWLEKHKLGTRHKYAIVTDGPWDMGRFLYGQCKISKIQFPIYARKWINVRKTYSCFYRCRRLTLQLMLEQLGIEFSGRPHCGLDDSRNIATVLLQMIRDGVSLEINEHIHSYQYGNANRNGKVTYGRHQYQQQSHQPQQDQEHIDTEDLAFALSLLSVQKEIDTEIANKNIEKLSLLSIKDEKSNEIVIENNEKLLSVQNEIDDGIVIENNEKLLHY